MCSSPSYQHYRVARSLEKFHREFGCETPNVYCAFDLVRFVLADSGLTIKIFDISWLSGKVSIRYALDDDESTHDVDTSLCMETNENLQKLERWREQGYFSMAAGTIVQTPQPKT